MKNRELIEQRIKPNGYTIGCYDLKIEELKKIEIKKILEAVDFYDNTDVSVTLNKKDYIVEVSSVDNQMDFNLISREEHIDRYGIGE